MAVPSVREQLNARLDTMSDEELAALLRYAEAMQSTSLPEDYDEANDPSIGFLSAEVDFASHIEDMLDAGFGQSKS